MKLERCAIYIRVSTAEHKESIWKLMPGSITWLLQESMLMKVRLPGKN